MENLRIPGPTPLPDMVLQAMTKQMINHRGAEYHDMLKKITDNLKILFQTKNDVFVLTSSGTGGLESAIVNTLSPGDKVLAVSIGVFGERIATIAKTFGAEVIPCNFEWGTAANPEVVRQALKDNPDVKAVLITHNETSTGVTNDLQALSEVIREFDKLILADAVSSLGSINLPVDEWGIDVAVTASQKGWMAPPGLAMVSISKKAWDAWEQAKMPRFYWDFGQARNYLEKWENPWTPCITAVYALDIALDAMVEEGIKNIAARHAYIAQLTRNGVKELGLPLFAEGNYASNTVTSVAGDKGLDINKMRKLLSSEYDITVAGGQLALNGKIFRIGHLGYVSEEDIKAVMVALKDVLPKAGFGSE